MSDSVERKPDNFDWVTARAECSTAVIFEKLKMFIAEDVEIRNKIRKKNTPMFKIVSANENRFSVVAELHPTIHLTVAFVLGNDEILVSDREGTIFSATVSLSNDGDCRAKIAGKEFDLWQLRKMALEKLFFREFQVLE